MNEICYLAIGSNMGDRLENLASARTAIAALPETRLLESSHDHTTRPVGGPTGQNDYLNAALKIQTSLPPQQLLAHLLNIEHHMGRDRSREGRNGPRIIDIDILLYNDIVLSSPALTIPHPRMHLRTFVLMPLCDIAPDVIHPVLGIPISLLAARCYAGGTADHPQPATMEGAP